MWYFSRIILDMDNEIGRIRSGREVCRSRKTQSERNEGQRDFLKQKVSNGEITPWEFLQAISHTIGTISIQPIHHSDSEDSGDDIDEPSTMSNMSTNWKHVQFVDQI